MNNSRNLALVSAAQARHFLKELANVERDSINRFVRRFGKIIPNQFGSGDLDEATIEAHSDKIVKKEGLTFHIEGALTPTVINLRNIVRKVWVEPDLRTKRYGVFLLWNWAMAPGSLDGLYMGVPTMPTTLPPPSPFEQSLQYLLDFADLARYCANPDCPAPYFFAKRRSQRYCSDACAIPAQREFKRKWWAEHGEDWRATREKVSQQSQSKRKKER